MTSDERFRESLHSLLYRYWFWEWLFVDMRRWLVVTAANIGVAAVLEKALAAMLSAAFFYTNGCIAVCVLAVTFVGWVFLGADGAPPARMP